MALGSTSVALAQGLTPVAWDRTPQRRYSNLKHIDLVVVGQSFNVRAKIFAFSLGLLVVVDGFFAMCAQACPTLCGPMDCRQAGASVHGIFQARILEWVAISYSRGFS